MRGEKKREKKKQGGVWWVWKGGGRALFVSCRGKLARARERLIGPVIWHRRVPENVAANHNIVQNTQKRKKKGGAENKKPGEAWMATNCLKLRERHNVTCAQADVTWPYQRNTAKCSQETLARSPGDEAAEASIAPGVGLQGKLLRLHKPCPFETKQRGMARGGWSASAKGGRFISSSDGKEEKKKNDWEDRGKWEQQQISETVSLFARQQRAYDIPASHPAGWSEVSASTSASLTLFLSQSDGGISFFFFSLSLLGCYPEHSNLIRAFDKHLTQSSGLLSLLPTAQGKRLRLTNFHPQFSLF